jgi:ribonuclease HI
VNSSADKILIYTDGACLGNPGAGGWGAVLIYGEHQKEISDCEAQTTNNRMELMAIIQALRALKRSSKVVIFTDSKYALDGITKWIKSWKQNGWRTANRKLVKNSDLWQELDLEVAKHQIEWQWVKGHAGDFFNELADKLANKQARSV